MKPFKEKKIVKILYKLGLFLTVFSITGIILSIVLKQDLSIFYLTSLFATIFVFIIAGTISNIDSYIRNLTLKYSIELKRVQNSEEVLKLKNELQNLISKSNSKTIKNDKDIQELLTIMDIKYEMFKKVNK